jgi:hypothetical protein
MKFHLVQQPEDSLPCSQEPAAGPSHDVNQIHILQSHFFKINLVLILPRMPTLLVPKCSFPSGFPTNVVLIYHISPFVLHALLIRLHSMILIKLGKNSCSVCMGTSEGKSPLRIPRRSWENNIKMDVREVGWGDMDLINLDMDRDQKRAHANTVISRRVP